MAQVDDRRARARVPASPDWFSYRRRMRSTREESAEYLRDEQSLVEAGQPGRLLRACVPMD